MTEDKPHAALVAAALSAAVTSTYLQESAPTFQAEPIPAETHNLKRPPLFGREREEGKDSHSRQWRLSMAVFLNRNKRPQAAPIEVAELLSEKPPPSHLSPYFSRFVFLYIRLINMLN